MKEIKAIIDAYDAIDHTTTKSALATVVRVEGSSYRRAGARMLIMDNGVWVGGISGGCLEGDALKRARLAIAQSAPSLVTYDTTEDDAHQIGVGLGCNGIIDVLITPLQAGSPNAVDLLRTCVEQPRQAHILLTITRLKGSVKGLQLGAMVPYAGADSLAVFGDSGIQEAIQTGIRTSIDKKKSGPASFDLPDGRELELFIEIMPPLTHVVLMGQQYDVYPMVRIIKELGWQATVVANKQKVTQTLFAAADAIVSPDAFEELTIDDHTAIILMAHDFKTDKNNLPKAMATNAAFIGILRPRVRTEKMLKELAAEGRAVTLNDRIHAPVGLDIGAVSPEEISLSIIAEIRADLSGRDGSFLRLRQSTIHERD